MEFLDMKLESGIYYFIFKNIVVYDHEQISLEEVKRKIEDENLQR